MARLYCVLLIFQGVVVAIDEEILACENAIDEMFKCSPLLSYGYDQAVWTLLSVLEDKYYKATIFRPLSDEDLHAHSDILLNAITYPLRVLYKEDRKSEPRLRRELIDHDYKLAYEWIGCAANYSMFCSIFPLWHRGKFDLEINEKVIEVDELNFSCEGYRYEAYNRLVRHDGDDEAIERFDVEFLISKVMKCTSIKGYAFVLNFNPALVSDLVREVRRTLGKRYVLPPEWDFEAFDLASFKEIYITIQAMLYGWYLARVGVASTGVPGYCYSSSVLVMSRDELTTRLARYTALKKATVMKVLDYLTFGSQGIREPDIAMQPLVELSGGKFALSPFVWINSNAERNFCVLLNKIPAARKIYLALSLEKERVLFSEVKEFAEKMGYEVLSGKLVETDVDVAIIDRKNKICACIELKWFVEPAEIREVEERSKELKKGVEQAGIIRELFLSGDDRLNRQVLKVDHSYRFLSFVGSRNWIGYSEIQDVKVPIIKVWHFLNQLKEFGSLSMTLDWMESRAYLPEVNKDYSIEPLDLKMGEWGCRWYGVKSLR